MQNSGKNWSNDEDTQLTNLFVKYHMDIAEIAKLHKRGVEAIRFRLIKLGLIENESNFIKQELIELDKDNNGKNGTLLLTEIISKHFIEYDKRINLLESKINELTKKLN